MPTPIDRALQSKAAVLGFAGMIGAVAAWTIWGSDSMFPPEGEPTGDPKGWSDDQMRRWLRNRNLTSTGKESREELIARIEAYLGDVKKPKT